MKAERWGVYRNPKKSETCLAWGNFITMTAESVGAGASVGGVGRFVTNDCWKRWLGGVLLIVDQC